MTETHVTADATKAERAAERIEADNWWWLVVRNPQREIHLFELGYAEDVETPTGALDRDGKPVVEKRSTALTDERRAVILAELGAPANAGELDSGWELSMAPGRPNAYLEPKEYDGAGKLLPIRARAGVTLHLAPESEPGTAAANGEDVEEDLP